MFTMGILATYQLALNQPPAMLLLRVTMLTALVSTLLASSSPPIEYSINEEIHIGTQIGNLAEDFGLTTKYGHNLTALSQLRFKLLNFPEPLQIEIDERTGQLRTITRIDRDTMCPQMVDCTLSYDVAVQPMAFFQIIKVVVKIVDVNDNSPSFAAQYLPVDIPESSELRSTFTLPSAFDPDSPQFGVRRYRLHPPHHPNFELHYELSTSPGVPDVVKLILTGRLDYEQETSYQLELVSFDGGDPPKAGRLPLDIVVIDDNDNAPRFENSTYEKFVMENFPVGSTIDRIKATDADSGLNGAVYFGFDAKTAKQFGNVFSMESGTGALVLRSSLDFEHASRYALGIVATDGGSNPQTSYALYTINVQDVNDNAPDIRINTLTPSGLAEVPENAEVGHFVAHMSVVDLDFGEAGKVTCTLSSDDFAMMRLYNMEYKIVTAQVFDYEVQQQAEVTVTCRDHGRQHLKSSAKIQVVIMDRNDNAPKFDNDLYTGLIEEGNELRSFLVKVTARDADSGANGIITYFVDEASSQYITVDDKSGVIRAKTSFDYERQRSYAFRIFAIDSGESAQTATATFALTIVDTNDERPRFHTDRYTFNIRELSPIGSSVGQVVATDADSHPFDRFQFRFEPTSSSAIDVFLIDSRTGVISTQRSLDHESTSVYFIGVVAYSDEVPFFSSTASVTVSITDVNDNAPRFVYPTERNNTLRVSAASLVGHEVCALRAEDPDDNTHLTFGIEGQTDSRGNRGGPFGVDPELGTVLVSVQLQQYVGREFVLHVVACDNGEPQLTSRAELRMLVTNDPLPVTSAKTAVVRSLLASESLTVVLGIVLLAVVVSILIIVAIVILLRKRRQLESRADDVSTVTRNEGHYHTTLPPPSILRPGLDHPTAYERANLNGRGNSNGSTLVYSTLSRDGHILTSSRPSPYRRPMNGDHTMATEADGLLRSPMLIMVPAPQVASHDVIMDDDRFSLRAGSGGSDDSGCGRSSEDSQRRHL